MISFPNASRLFPHILIVLLLTAINEHGNAQQEFYRVVYSNDPIRGHRANETDFEIGDDPRIEKAYASKYVVLPSANANPPQSPLIVPGVLISTAESDREWVMAQRPEDNLSYHFDELSKSLGGKMSEYQFVKKYAPTMAPPRLEYASFFIKSSLLSPEQLKKWRKIDELKIQQRKVLRKAVSDAISKLNPEYLNQLRDQILEIMDGPAILKADLRNHSEGKVPKARKDKDWSEIWRRYLVKTRPAIQKELAKIDARNGSQEEIADFLAGMDYSEGFILEEALLDPQSIVIQKMMEIAKEVRIHAVKGQILKGATFLRMYPLGQYLTSQEIFKVERAFEKDFLANLPPRLRYFASSSDIAIERNTGRLVLLDLNPGYYSGYFFPEEDLFTTHLLARHFSGVKSEFLNEFEDFKHATSWGEKRKLLQGIRKKYGRFIFGTGAFAYEHESFWDKVIRHLIDDVILANNSKDARPQLLSEALATMKDARLNSIYIYYQFINEMQNEHHVLLPQSQVGTWVEFLKKCAIEDKSLKRRVYETGGKIIVEESTNASNALGLIKTTR